MHHRHVFRIVLSLGRPAGAKPIGKEQADALVGASAVPLFVFAADHHLVCGAAGILHSVSAGVHVQAGGSGHDHILCRST